MLCEYVNYGLNIEKPVIVVYHLQLGSRYRVGHTATTSSTYSMHIVGDLLSHSVAL